MADLTTQERSRAVLLRLPELAKVLGWKAKECPSPAWRVDWMLSYEFSCVACGSSINRFGPHEIPVPDLTEPANAWRALEWAREWVEPKEGVTFMDNFTWDGGGRLADILLIALEDLVWRGCLYEAARR